MGKIAFYLMTQKGLGVLKGFLNQFSASIIEAVIISRDKNVENDYYVEFQKLCAENNLTCYDKKDNYTIDSEYIIAVSWRWLIKSEQKVIVLHDSLLPRYKGFAPLVNSLINGEKEIGVTALFASDTYDGGNIISQKKVVIGYPITIAEAINKITPLYSELVNEIAAMYLANEAIGSVQQEERLATYSLWRDGNDYFINWSQSAASIKRFIDAVGYPYKGAHSRLNNQIVVIKEAVVVPDVVVENRMAHIGKIIFIKENRPIVVCGEGLLRLDKIEDTDKNEFLLKEFRLKFLS